jgi:hypothetical protein
MQRIDSRMITLVLGQFDSEILIAKCHYAICLVLWGLALRRQEIY